MWVKDLVHKLKTMELSRKRYVCRECGGTDIEWNVYQYWDIKKQKLITTEVNRTYCIQCDSEDNEREEIETIT